MAKKKPKEDDSSVLEIIAEKEQTTVKQAMVKALVITGGASSEEIAFSMIDGRKKQWDEVEAVDPILDPDSLLALYQLSDCLRQNVESYATNIEGNGHVLTPKIDLSPNNRNAPDEVKNALDASNWSDAVMVEMAKLDKKEEDGETVTTADRKMAIKELEVPPPTDEEVRAEMERLDLQMQRERHTAETWFRNVHPKLSFIDLRELKRVDEESIGRAYWEVSRDSRGFARRLEPVSGHTVLPLKGEGDEVKVQREEWVSKVHTRLSIEEIKFHRFVQRTNGKTTYFKDFGDPRLVSDKTGKVYMREKVVDGKKALVPDYTKMKKDEPKARPAKELIFFPIHSPQTTAGMIRWSGMITPVLGSREAAESNLAYFENHAVPDAVLMVSGGQLNNASIERIQERARKTKGGKNHHRTLVVQASGGKQRPNEKVNNPDMEWKNLGDFQLGDALFMGYTEKNKEAVSSAFRQALLLIGHIPSDLNRATALAIMSLVEKQVYGPLRRKFDWWVNNILFPEIGITLLKFESLSPEAQNIEEMAKALENGVKGGAFTPNMLLDLYGLWFNREFPKIEEAWGDIPFAATLSQLNLEVDSPDDEGVDDKGDDGKTVAKAFDSRLSELEGQFSVLHRQVTEDSVRMSGL